MENSPFAAFAPNPTDEHEARLLADLVRLSRATVLLAERGSNKSAFLKTRLLPRLNVKDANEAEVCILFDQWNGSPLANLVAQVKTLLAEGTDAPESAGDTPPVSLIRTLTTWQQRSHIRFIFVIDRFEEFLDKPPDDMASSEFRDLLVDLLNTSNLSAHFLISLDERAEPLLGPLRRRIAGLGDASLRLATRDTQTSAQPGLVNGDSNANRLIGSERHADPQTLASDYSLYAPSSVRPSAMAGGAPSSSSIARAADVDQRIPERAAVAAEPLGALQDISRNDSSRASIAPSNTETSAAPCAKRPFRLPRRAWLVFGTLVLSLSFLLALTLGRQTGRTPNEPPLRPVPAATVTEPASSDGVATQYEFPPSPADDQIWSTRREENSTRE